MKKLTLGLMAIFSSYVGETMASVPTGLSRCATNVPTFQGGFTFGFQGLYWRATTPELDYALTFPSDISVYRSVIDSGYRAGFSANMGYIFGCSGNDFRISYTHWDNKYNDNIDNIALIPALTGIFNTGTFEAFFPTGITFTGSIGILADFVGTVPVGNAFFSFDITNSDINAASATANFNNRSADLEFGQTANIGRRMRLRWFGGLRYANLENTLEVSYSGATEPTIVSTSLPLAVTLFSTVTTLTTVAIFTAILVFDITATFIDVLNQKTDFEGIGPRFGFDASYHLGLGFGLVGGLSASLIIGENDANLAEFFDVDGLVTLLTLPPDGSTLVSSTTDITVETITPTTPQPFNLGDLTTFQHPSLTRVVPNLEAYIGVDWTYEFPNCSKTLIDIQLGYKITHYFNAVDRLCAVGADAPAARTRHIDDVQFEGPYVGIQINL